MPSLCVKAAFTGLSVNGSMAEYMVAPDYSFYKIPDAVPDDLAALVEPFDVAFHAIRQGQLMIGDTVAIVGAGPIGDIVQIAAKAAGASKVFQIELSKRRREIAKDLGADFVIDPAAGDVAQQLMDVNGGMKADVVFECVGNAAAPITALAVTRNAGTMVLVGIYGEPSPTMNFGDPSFGQKKIIGSLAYSREATMVLDLLADGRIDAKKAQKLITGRIALKDTVEKGFHELIHNKEKNLKILVESPNWS
jgi:(R,R)-butanediol dehydrogenase/meso-butanediol dehydrogenase/diacetyl reductase